MSDSVCPGVWVTLHTLVRDGDGETVADETVERLVGYGQLLPRVETAVSGATVGTKRTLSLRAADAFGDRDPKAIVEVDRDEFPEDVMPGDHFDAEDAAGKFVLLTVLDVDSERVVLDQNHPLAGQALTLELEVRALRLASSDELAAAEAALEAAPEPDISLIPTQALLAGAKGRYEDPQRTAKAPRAARGRRGKSGDKR
ncbi:MAG: hypothetical protein R3B13_29815 [Polyangiaceae bacterium]